MMKTYYMLTKPGIIMGNVITTIAGFALASRGHWDLGLLFATLIGMSLVIASAGVFNNYLDRKADAKMERTKNRPLVRHLISEQKALIFATCLGLAGIAILSYYTNPLTVAITIFGFFTYVVLYIICKYHSVHGTLVGSVSGAIPPLIGYCAVNNAIDTGAILLFLILVMWQMPHFFAIAIYRFEDYLAASIPVMPVIKGMFVTKMHMFCYIVGFLIVCTLLTVFQYTGYAYLAIAILLSCIWLGLCLTGFKNENDHHWGKQMFSFSLVTINVLCLMMILDVK